MAEHGSEDWGVAPHVEVKLRSDELRKRLDVQKDNDVLVKADHSTGAEPLLRKHTVEETLGADAQLAIGLMVVKTHLIDRRTQLAARQDGAADELKEALRQKEDM